MIKKYAIEKAIGNGNFSTVYRAKDTTTNRPCAIKIMRTHEKIAQREAILLKKFNHPNIIQLLAFEQNNNQSMIVLEQGGINTLELYESYKNGLREEQVKCVLFQTALGLAYVHSFGIIHRDIKPENLLIDKNTAEIKIIDFGLAIEESNVNTDYIATRWYRAPENLLGTKEYSCAIDVFSLGCVIVELYLGGPLFPGNNNLDQLIKIFDVLGYPGPSNWSTGYSKMMQLGLKTQGKPGKHSIGEILRPCDQKLIDIIVSMLDLNPERRIKCVDIIKNQYFKNIKKTIPPIVFSRFEQDHQIKKQLNFKATNHYRHSKMNMNMNLRCVNAPQERHTVNMKKNEKQLSQNFRDKKSTSIDSLKSYNESKNNSFCQRKEGETINPYKLNKHYSARDLNDHSFSILQSAENRKFTIQDSSKNNIGRSSMEKKLGNISKKSIIFGNSQRKIRESIEDKKNLPLIPNIPLVQLQSEKCQNVDKKYVHALRSHQSPLHNFHMQIHNNFSIKPSFHQINQPQQTSLNKNNSPQISEKQENINKQSSMIRGKASPLINTRMNQSYQQNLKPHFSPQNNFTPLNFYRNQHYGNVRRPEEVFQRRNHCSPTIHHFHSPAPISFTQRRNTCISPPSEQKISNLSSRNLIQHNRTSNNDSGISIMRRGHFTQAPYPHKK